MKDFLLIIALVSSLSIAYIPITWVGKYIKEKRERNISHLKKR